MFPFLNNVVFIPDVQLVTVHQFTFSSTLSILPYFIIFLFFFTCALFTFYLSTLNFPCYLFLFEI